MLRVIEIMALAVYYEDLIRKCHVRDYAEIATLGQTTRARVTQIRNLRLLAPPIQEQFRNLSRIVSGRDRWSLRDLRSRPGTDFLSSIP